MKLELRPKQKQTLNQRMLQYADVLQLDARALEDYLAGLALENPVLLTLPAQKAYTSGAERYARDFAQNEDAALYRPKRESLQEYLSEQIAAAALDKKTEKAVRFLAECLDSRGYLPEAIEESCGWDDAFFASALEALQALEPAGVGARNLEECLILQLARQQEPDPLLYALIKEHMERLGKGQLHHIASALDVPVARVAAARDRLAALNPKPGNGFGADEDFSYVVPDVIVTQEPDGTLKTTDARRYFPGYTVDRQYEALLAGGEASAEEKQYLREKLQKAREAVESVERRWQSVMACAQLIVNEQRDFFLSGSAPLKPMSVQGVAEKLGVHVSTASRMLKSKYIACRFGAYPFDKFIQRGIRPDGGANSDVTRADATARICALIEGEDKAKPLSDQRIAALLGEEGIDISRRTVAKYREEAMLPAAAARKRER